MQRDNTDLCAGFVRVPLADALAAHLRERIAAGVHSDKLPAERQLAERLGVSRPSLRAALDILKKEGLLVRRHGRVTRVTRR